LIFKIISASSYWTLSLLLLISPSYTHNAYIGQTNSK
jgi:hypothetical protein